MRTLGLCAYKVRARKEDSTRDERKGCEREGQRERERRHKRAQGGAFGLYRPPAKILEQGLFCAFVFMLSRPVLYY